MAGPSSRSNCRTRKKQNQESYGEESEMVKEKDSKGDEKSVGLKRILRGKRKMSEENGESEGKRKEVERKRGKGVRKRKVENLVGGNQVGGEIGDDDEVVRTDEMKSLVQNGKRRREDGEAGCCRVGSGEKDEIAIGEKGVVKNEIGYSGKRAERERVKRERKDGNLNEDLFGMCHQCQYTLKDVVRCTTCKKTPKRYCIHCIEAWYPHMTKEEIAERCPFCRRNCNCKACLRLDGGLRRLLEEEAELKISEDDKLRHFMHLFQAVLPHLKEINEEQLMEKSFEAKIRGLAASELEIKEVTCEEDERMFCNYCKTSISYLVRSCPLCYYDLCLTCCHEIRAGNPQGGAKDMIVEYEERVFNYLHGENSIPCKVTKLSKRSGKKKISAREAVVPELTENVVPDIPSHGDLNEQTNQPVGRNAKNDGSMAQVAMQTLRGVNLHDEGVDHGAENGSWIDLKVGWKANEDGSIPCPPSHLGGCGGALLELARVFPLDVSELLKKAEALVSSDEVKYASEAYVPCCSCISSVDHNTNANGNSRKAASRESSSDNYLYYPAATDSQSEDLEHFQWHWSRAEPVIVRGVLETTPGLSWEPMVMWRAFRQLKHVKKKEPPLLQVKAIDCLDWCE
ncbi:Lysine-specific demethylase JMJ25-like protein, partial [Drosera capensis]